MANINLIRYAGAEVFNTERLAAYIANGLVPPDVQFDVDVCDGLAAASEGDAFVPYRTPTQDEPPWFDAEDSDTWDFAGVLPVEVTGMDDSTRTVDVSTTVAGSGLPGRPRRGPRTMGVTATLIGRTSESVYAGLAWLERTLHGGCDADEATCGPQGALEYFTVCPTPVMPTVDLDVPTTITMPSPSDPDASPGAWTIVGGTFTTPVATDDPDVTGTALHPYPADPTVYDAGDSLTMAADTQDGGGARDGLPVLDDGTAAPILAPAVVGGLEQSCNPGPTVIQWYLRADPQGFVQMALVDDGGNIILLGPEIFVTDAWEVYLWDLPLGVDEALWRPTLVTTLDIEVGAVTIDGFAFLSPEVCVDPYRRVLPTVVTTDGPTITDELDTGCGVILTVEWVWVATSPYRYGAPVNAITDLGWGVAPSYAAPGVTYDDGGGAAIPATPWNCDPPTVLASCAIDPLAASFGIPPAAPVIVDTTRPDITTQDVRSVWANIGPEQTPANEGVFTIRLVTPDDPIVGARVRVYDTADASGDIPDLCDFAYEFLIDYIPADAIMVIDGTTETITTVCGGLTTAQDASPGVRGAYGGPVVPPVLRCDRRYLVLVQWLDVYPRTAPGFYTEDDAEGSLLVSIDISTREG